MTISTQTRINMREIHFFTLLLLFIGLPCISYAEILGTYVQNPPVCDPKCGCDGMYSYDEAKDECVLNLHKLMKQVVVHYKNDPNAILSESGMGRSIFIEAEKTFYAINVSVVLVMTCAAICVLSACIYCCRIDYTDRKLKKEVKALAKKMNKTYKNEPPKSKPTEQKSQSCNVVVEEAGVFVV